MRSSLRSFRSPCSLARATALAASSVALLLASTATADLPPPDGVKYVGFEVVVDNLAAFPDMVVLAYPWSMSGGAPTTEHAPVKAGEPLGVGRRSPTPRLWAMTKADYEAFVATYKSTHSYEDPALDALFKSDKVRACDATVAPEFNLPESDARDRIVQRFRAEAVDPAKCHLVAVGPQPGDGAGESGDGVQGSAPGVRADVGKGGCAGCTTSAADADPTSIFFAITAAAVGVAVALRRQRPRGTHRP